MLLKEVQTEVSKAGNDYKTFPRLTYLCLIVAGVGGLYLFSLAASIIISAAGIGGEYANASNLFISYSFMAIALILIIGYNIKDFKSSFANLKSYFVGIFFGALIILLPMLYSSIVNLFYKSDINGNEQGLRSIIMAYPTLSIIFLGFIGPICEEIVYRLGIFESIKKPRWLAYVVSILIFAFMHFDVNSNNMINEAINLPVYLLSGTLLAFAYDKFNIATSLTAHVINNLFSVIMFIISQSI